jgi:hypothetical protein
LHKKKWKDKGKIEYLKIIETAFQGV